MFLIALLFTAIFFLLGVFFLTSFATAFRALSHREEQLEGVGKRFFYRKFHNFFFPDQEVEGIFFVIICAQSISRILYAGLVALFLEHSGLIEDILVKGQYFSLQWIWIILSIVAFLIFSFIVGDFIPRVIGSRLPKETLHFAAPVSSIFMFLVFPISYIFLKVAKSLSKTIYLDQFQDPLSKTKQEIIDIINRASLSPSLDPLDKLMIESVLEFKERIAREIMIPRVDIFSLPAETPINEAARMLVEEGYSRVPVYKTNVDQITGVIMYKDILSMYMKYVDSGNDENILKDPIETIMKNVLYTPETKKISHLLQDFKKNKVHQAIVVDEYGGTEGIVTIEDILEEIVGEICDEFDEDEQLLIVKTNDGWIVDARLSILDAEEKFNITFPENADYDTLGGYIFHEAGTIPEKGFIIHQNDFELEILKSNKRCVDKIKIKPMKNEHGQKLEQDKEL